MNYLIDCGTHFFQGFDLLREKYGVDQSWKCFCFEANPYAYSRSLVRYNELVEQGYDIEYENVAVYDSNDTIAINCVADVESKYISQRSNIIDDDIASDFRDMGIQRVKKVSVNTIDLSEFLLHNVTSSDFVVLKLDIEGAEFPVLDKMINDETYTLIDHLYCEFHEKFFRNFEDFSKLKQKYIDCFNDAGIQVDIWN